MIALAGGRHHKLAGPRADVVCGDRLDKLHFFAIEVNGDLLPVSESRPLYLYLCACWSLVV